MTTERVVLVPEPQHKMLLQHRQVVEEAGGTIRHADLHDAAIRRAALAEANVVVVQGHEMVDEDFAAGASLARRVLLVGRRGHGGSGCGHAVRRAGR